MPVKPPYTEDDLIKKGVNVIVVEKDGKMIINYAGNNQSTSRWNHDSFTFRSDPLPSLEIAQYIADKVINNFKPIALFGSGKASSDRVKARDLRTQYLREYKSYVKDPEVLERKTSLRQGVFNEPITEDPELYFNEPIFNREADDNGRTSYFAGLSASGKTTLCVTELNKVVNLKRGGDDHKVEDRYMWERIIILTTSQNSKPWKDLKDPNHRIRIVPFYLPRLIGLLKRINDVCDNKCPYLLIFDDCFKHTKGNTFKSLALILRNSNLSSCSLSQRYNDISPGCRQSIHQTLVTKFTDDDWLKIIKEQIKKEVVRILVNQNLTNEAVAQGRGSDQKLSSIWEKFVGSNIVHYDQRKRKVSIIKRDAF